MQIDGTSRLWCEEGGSGSPTLVLLHGLGANGAVWEGLQKIVAAKWPGRWVVPDLRGHGRSFHRAPYGFGIHAADVAGLLAPDEEVVLLGHSMGGVVAMMLASDWFGITVRQVIACGVIWEWQAADTVKLQQVARSPVRWFPTRDQAVERHLRVSGLHGLLDHHAPAALHGVVEENGQFRLAMDPAANRFAVGSMTPIVAAMNAPLRVAAGEKDTKITLAQMRQYDPNAVALPGVGHNLHVEAPELLWELLETLCPLPMR